MSHELCPNCKPYGECMFKKAAKAVAAGVPPLKPGEKFTANTIDAHEMIAVFREKAREQNCPIVNSVNPHYPGKKNL